MDSDAALWLDSLQRSYGQVVAVQDVNIKASPGEFISLLGPSGSGKTTTLRLIGGFDRPSSGRILLKGRDVTRLPPHARDTATIFQSGALFPHKTVAENIAYGLRMRQVPKTEIAARITEMLDIVRLRGFEGRFPTQLSGGQRQRVALARSLAVRPAVLLFDEPLSALDLSLRVELRGEIKRLHEELGFTAIFVTHDQVEAMALSDRVAVMNHGRIEQIGRPEDVFHRPENEFVYTFIGESICLPVRSVGPGYSSIAGEPMALHLARPLAVGDHRIYVRPNRIRMFASQDDARRFGNCIESKVRFVEFLGDYYRSHVISGSAELFCDFDEGGTFGVGDTAWLAWSDQDMKVFPIHG